jgi:thioredoxin-related protein
MMINNAFSKAIALGLGLVSLAWIAIAGAAVRGEEIPYVSDLTREAKLAREGRLPLLILFRAPDCVYCERVSKEFLLPLQRNPSYTDKVILRQVNIRANSRMVDFAGKTLTQAQFAKQQMVRFAPTVKLLDADGNALAEPLVGLTTPDFYGAYLDRAIDEALRKVRVSTGE